MRKKKMIWWEHETAVGGADEARQRGASEGAGRRSPDAPYYGPVTLQMEGDDVAGPDTLTVPGG